MKILLVINTLKIGGAETFVVNLANYLTKNTVENIFLLNLNLYNFKNENNLEPSLKIDINRYITIRLHFFYVFLNNFKITRKIFNIFCLNHYNNYEVNQVKNKIKEIHPDIIISFLIGSDRIINQCDLNIPHIIVDQGDYRVKSNDRNELLEKCSYVVCVSNANLNLMKEYYDKDNIKVIYNAYSRDILNYCKHRKDFNIPEEVFVYIIVARGIKEKGWIEAVVAFSKLKQYKKSYLILVGDGKGVEEAKEFSKVNSLENIKFTGFLTKPDEFMQLANVAILPSYFYSESLPLSLIECLWFDLPIIATNIGGIPEIIKDKEGDCGILIELENGKPNINRLKESMDYMFENINKFKKNIPHCREKFDLKNISQEYIDLCYTVINS